MCGSQRDFWNAMDLVADHWHAVSSPKNIGIMGTHFARAIDFVIGCKYLHTALKVKKPDGDLPHLSDRAESFVDQAVLLERVKSDWSALEYYPVMPNAEAVKAVAAEIQPKRGLPGTGSQVFAQGLEGDGEQLAFAFERGAKSGTIADASSPQRTLSTRKTRGSRA